MGFDEHRNFAYSTIKTPPSPPDSGHTFVVQVGDGAKFPNPPFNVVVWRAGSLAQASNAEILRVTARSGDTFTVDRAQEGSTARSVVVGDQVGANITAKILTDIEQAVGAVSTYTHAQPVPTATWTVPHGLSRHPNVLVVDTAGTQVFGEVDYPSLDQVIVRFSAPFGGTAYLS